MTSRKAIQMMVLATAVAAHAPAGAATVSELFKKVKDSVVVVRPVEKHLPILPGGEPLTAAGLGSGVVIDAEKSYVMTAAHVIHRSAGPHSFEITRRRSWLPTS